MRSTNNVHKPYINFAKRINRLSAMFNTTNKLGIPAFNIYTSKIYYLLESLDLRRKYFTDFSLYIEKFDCQDIYNKELRGPNKDTLMFNSLWLKFDKPEYLLYNFNILLDCYLNNSSAALDILSHIANLIFYSEVKTHKIGFNSMAQKMKGRNQFEIHVANNYHAPNNYEAEQNLFTWINYFKNLRNELVHRSPGLSGNGPIRQYNNILQIDRLYFEGLKKPMTNNDVREYCKELTNKLEKFLNGSFKSILNSIRGLSKIPTNIC